MLLTMEDDEPWPKSLVGVTYCVILYTDNYYWTQRP